MQVKIYTLPSCVQCDATKRSFKNKGIEYTEVSLQDEPGALELVKELGYQAAPVIVAGESHWSGFRPDMIATLTA